MEDDFIVLAQNKDGTWRIKPEPYLTLEIETEEVWKKLQEIIRFWNENHPDDKVFEGVDSD